MFSTTPRVNSPLWSERKRWRPLRSRSAPAECKLKTHRWEMRLRLLAPQMGVHLTLALLKTASIRSSNKSSFRHSLKNLCTYVLLRSKHTKILSLISALAKSLKKYSHLVWTPLSNAGISTTKFRKISIKILNLRSIPTISMKSQMDEKDVKSIVWLILAIMIC